MRNIAKALLATLAISSTAVFGGAAPLYTLNCDWLDAGHYSVGYFRPAQLTVTMTKTSVRLRGSYLSRYYEPCWAGSFKSCMFDFSLHKSGVLKILALGERRIELERSGEYGVAHIDLIFSKPLAEITPGTTFEMTFDGDDGDGTFVNFDRFSCRRLR